MSEQDFNEYHKHSVEIYWFVGIIGPLFTLAPILMLYKCKLQLEEMHAKRKVSINIINVWMYNCIIMTLIIQVIISGYSTIVILYTQSQKDTIS